MRLPRSIIVFVCIYVASVALGAEKTGTITGVVRFTGTVPPARQVPSGDGAFVEQQDLIVEPKSKGLRWVIAALEDAPAQPKLSEGDSPVVMDQKNMVFIPRVLTVQHGQPVRFDNSDALNHSVTIFSRIRENELNVFVTTKDPVTKAFASEKAPLRIGCAIHPAMTAWLYVAPHQWHTVTDEKGVFTIKDVPAGKYTLLLRHPDTGLQERQQLEVQVGKKLEVAVEWKEPKPKRDAKDGSK